MGLVGVWVFVGRKKKKKKKFHFCGGNRYDWYRFLLNDIFEHVTLYNKKNLTWPLDFHVCSVFFFESKLFVNNLSIYHMDLFIKIENLIKKFRSHILWL